ncbi:heat shock protein Hsp15 [Austwickia chelonae]|uniref:Putative RNA-binding protein n=1 Tax=Austwickia chelonae NBRC 105200 TaxID=1184607 RepID=K6VQX6_9MICO|nr:S4 domain-containing protein [Austwickia chelonae]GAB79144.1 putative RNA-binding protein [Austwickia chelonae NBRC 105200]SEW42640.1 heat shock protein Hsp15 [Austwickia chelonae]
MAEGSGVRVDSWLWSVRVYKSRSLATAGCKAGHVHVDGVRVKPSALVRPGDRVVVRGGPQVRILVVKKLLSKRVGAAVAAEAMVDESPPPPPREERPAVVAARERGAGRPTKRERRELDRFRGR